MKPINRVLKMTPIDKFEHHFCLRVKELSDLVVQSKNESDLLRISANLRLLLLDGLMHKANRRLRLQIRFFVTDYQIPEGVIAWSIQDGIYPPTAIPIYQRILIDLDHFLVKPVALMNGQIITVKDAIKFEAHVQGGVHVENVNVNDPKENAMDKIPMIIAGYRPTLRQLVPIARVTLDALTPLRNAILETKPAVKA